MTTVAPHMVHKAGFATLGSERAYRVDPSRIEGALPPTLRGTLFRNGPGRNELGGRPLGHWFDGDGMVHAFRFDAGRVDYRGRYVRTPKYVRETAAGRVTERSFGQNRPGGMLANLGRMPANAANTSVVHHAGRLLALWEGGHPYHLDATTLETLGAFDFDGRLGPLHAFSAHGRIDPCTGRYVNFGIRFTARGFVAKIYDIDAAGRIERSASIPVGAHPFVHDFAMSEHYLVFFVGPLAMKGFVPYVLGRTTFDRALSYAPEEGMEVVVVRRSDLRVHARIPVDPFVVVHFGNAYEVGESIVLDLIRFEDFSVGDALREVLRSQPQQGGRLFRCRIDLAGRRVEGRPCSDVRCEFPAFDSRRATRASDHLYAVATLPNETPGFFNGLVHQTASSGQVDVHDLGRAQFTSEALFVPRTEESPEGDGFLLSVVLDAEERISYVRIGDASELDRVYAKVWLEHHVPFGFHGFFTPEVFG